MTNIALTGSTGLVGSRILQLLSHRHTVVPVRHSDCDITRQEDVKKYFSNIDYDVIVHSAAYTQVDKAEEEPDVAKKINSIGTKNLVEIANQMKKKLIYISTDFVFNGTDKNALYTEVSDPQPVGVYGSSKYEGEKWVHNDGLILRISYPYGPSPGHKLDFVRIIRNLLKQGKKLSMIHDSIITPTYIDDIADAIDFAINNYTPGYYMHVAGSTHISPLDAGVRIAEMWNLPKNLISKTSFSDYYRGKAPRPQYSKLRSSIYNRTKSFDDGLILLKQSGL